MRMLKEKYDSTKWDMSVPNPVETIADETRIKLLLEKQSARHKLKMQALTNENNFDCKGCA